MTVAALPSDATGVRGRHRVAIEYTTIRKGTVTMLKGVSRGRLIGVWFAIVIALMACSVAGGAAVTLNMGELWLGACLVPPAVMWFVWRGAPPLTVAELLYSVNTPSKNGRP
jgi:hypothetical protein